LALWALGPERLDETAQRAAAVVGTRAATAYGDDMAVEVPLARVPRFNKWPAADRARSCRAGSHRYAARAVLDPR
jgi:hypothetical protein